MCENIRVPPPPGVGALIFSYIRRLDPFLGGFKILNFNILGASEISTYLAYVCGVFVFLNAVLSLLLVPRLSR